MMRLLMALLLVLIAAAPTAGQTVHGVLRDSGRERPLPGVRLVLMSDDGVAVDSALTDRAGRFRLTGRTTGIHHLHFRLDGWASVLSDPVRLEQERATEFDFRVPLVATAAIRQMSDAILLETRLQQNVRELCGEPFRAWEAGLLVGTVRSRATREPVAGATVAVAAFDGAIARSTIASDNGIYVLCNLPVGPAVPVTVETPGGLRETTEVEIRAGTASWYDLSVGSRRR
jgi:hypothetical protein